MITVKSVLWFNPVEYTLAKVELRKMQNKNPDDKFRLKKYAAV